MAHQHTNTAVLPPEPNSPLQNQIWEPLYQRQWLIHNSMRFNNTEKPKHQLPAIISGTAITKLQSLGFFYSSDLFIC